jgi:hypothetical protein
MINKFLKSAIITFGAVAMFVLGGSVVAAAQGAGPLKQLDGRASASLKAQVTTLADSLTGAGLPSAPIIDKTLEGISKGANEQRIMIAVRAVASDLGRARRALGPSSDNELAAAVAVLRAGSSPTDLAKIRKELPGRSLVVPLSVLASFLVDGTPSSSAMLAVVTTARQASDANLLAYGRAVSRDIASGVTPLTAISTARQSGMSFSDVHPTGTPTLEATVPHTIHPPPKPKP